MKNVTRAQAWDLWAEALESGEYRQGRERLKAVKGDVAQYCCLGVLCEIMELPKKNGLKTGEAEVVPVYYGCEQSSAFLPVELCEFMGGLSYDARIPDEVCEEFPAENYTSSCTTLIGANDTGMGFPAIAEIVRAMKKHYCQ